MEKDNSLRDRLNEGLKPLSNAVRAMVGEMEGKTPGVSCKCGCYTYTHRHSNWIECTNCHLAKTVTPDIDSNHNLLTEDQFRKHVKAAYQSGFESAIEVLQIANAKVQKRKG